MSSEAADVVCRPVGLVRSRFTEATGMPIQTAGAPEETGRVEVFAEFAPGLRDIEGFNTAETAKLLGVSENVVKVRLHRARQALRELLDPHMQKGA